MAVMAIPLWIYSPCHVINFLYQIFPTCVCQQCWRTKVCRVFKKLANIKCWSTMLAVYELVRFLLANKRQTVRCDWLAVVNIMAAECRDASYVDYTNYTSPFYLCIINDCTQTDFGRYYVFAYKQLNKSLLQQRRHRLLSTTSPPYCCPTKCCRVWHKCWPTIIVGQQMLTNNCWPTFVGRVSAAEGDHHAGLCHAF